MTHIITIRPAGDLTVVDWPEGDLLRTLYEQIGCNLVTAIDVGPYMTLWGDDEALRRDTPQVNEAATKLIALFGPLSCYLFDTVVLTGPADANGATTPLGIRSVTLIQDTLTELAQHPMPKLTGSLWHAR